MATITSLNENDSGSTSRGVINTNFSNLNNQVKIIYKSADETVNDSATLQNDDALILPVSANEVWGFQMFLLYNSGTTPDLKIKWSVPTSTTMLWDITGNYNDNADTEATTQTHAGSGSVAQVSFTGTIFVSATAGNVILQWAQNTQNASNTIVKAGSYIIAHRLA